MDSFIGACIFVALIICFGIVATTGPTPEKFIPEDFHLAVETCSNNKGVEYIEIDLAFHDLHCNDGAFFQNFNMENVDRRKEQRKEELLGN